MKKLLLWMLLFLCLTQSFSQTVSIDTCNGDRISRPSNDDLNKVFAPSGLYLDRKYDWSQETVNCHINRAILSINQKEGIEKKMKNNAIVGYVVMIPGELLFIIASLSGGLGKGLFVPSILIAGGGYAIAIGGRKKNRAKAEKLNLEAQYHVNEVRKYYKNQGW